MARLIDANKLINIVNEMPTVSIEPGWFKAADADGQRGEPGVLRGGRSRGMTENEKVIDVKWK